MNLFNNHLYVSVLIFIIFIFVIFYLKPKCFFKNDKMLETGVGNNKTLFSYPVLMIVLSIVIYIVVCLCVE